MCLGCGPILAPHGDDRESSRRAHPASGHEPLNEGIDCNCEIEGKHARNPTGGDIRSGLAGHVVHFLVAVELLFRPSASSPPSMRARARNLREKAPEDIAGECGRG